MLKALNHLQCARNESRVCHVAFVTHSEATKDAIENFLSVIDTDKYYRNNRREHQQTLQVSTLSRICAMQLRQQISDAEFIDRDALDAKELQRLYIEDALAGVMREEFPSHRRFISETLKQIMETADSSEVAEMIQHEISVLIKGRSGENFDSYRETPTLRYGLPVESDADKGFVFTVFRRYQDLLGEAAQFDTDDVVLTAIGQLDTPVWRRRRAREAFDVVFVDETHLFNINELHLFHYFTKSDADHSIVYSMDRSQAVGDHGWAGDTTPDSFISDGVNEEVSAASLETVFRSSLEIVELAFSILSSGATLFTNFQNPMDLAISSFTLAEEKLAAQPSYIEYASDEAMIVGAFARQGEIVKALDCSRSDILIVALDHAVLDRVVAFAEMKNRPHVVLQKRGDVKAVEGSRSFGRTILAHADYVGGLEFLAVILVGVDGGRVPPGYSEQGEASRNFQTYSSHNRLYVAVSRARYRVEILGESSRGPSRVLSSAIDKGILQKISSPGT